MSVNRRLNTLPIALVVFIAWRQNCVSVLSKARFPLPELTARVNGPSWRVTGFHYPSTRPVLTGNGNLSPVNSGRQLGQWKPGLSVAKWQDEDCLTLMYSIWLADINPTDITPSVRTPCSGKAGRNPKDITPSRIRTQCTMSFSVTEKWVLKAKFQDWWT